MKSLLDTIKNIFKTGKPLYPVYCHFNHRLQKYTVLQIVKKPGEEPNPQYTVVVQFTWVGDKPITAREFRRLTPFKDYYLNGAPCYEDNFQPIIPRPLIYIGNFPAQYPWKGLSHSYSYWILLDDPAERMYFYGSIPASPAPVKKQYDGLAGVLKLSETENIVTIHNSALDEVITTKRNFELILQGKTSIGRITDPNCGRLLDLEINSDHFLIKGLSKIAKLQINISGDIDLRQIVKYYPNLQCLSLFSKNGTLSGLSALKKLPNLEVFRCVDMFGYDAADMPKPDEIPKLFYIILSGLPAEAAKNIKAKWKNIPGVFCQIRKARKSGWIEENRDNPFRMWDGREHISSGQAKKAFEIYKEAKNKVLALVELPEPERLSALATISRDFGAALQKMDQRRPFVETEEREEAGDVMEALWELAVDQCGVTLDKDMLEYAYVAAFP